MSRAAVRQAAATLAANVATVLAGDLDAESSLPALDVDTPVDTATGGDVHRPEIDVQLAITAYATTRDSVDDLLQRVGVRIDADRTLAGIADYCEYVGFARPDRPTGDEERTIHAGTATWLVHVR